MKNIYEWSVVVVVEGSYGELKVEIKNIKEDIKEIKQDNKETKAFYQTVIAELKENAIRQTEILNNQEKKFAEVNNDIAELDSKFDNTLQNNIQSNTKWYQDFVNNNFGMVFKVLVYLILALAGVKLAGFDVSKLIGL